MYLFFDTETTGVPKNYKAPASEINNWPRLVQIAWLLVDADGVETKSAEYIIKPNGFSISAEASKIHGITNEIARQTGTVLPTVLAELRADMAAVDLLIAHNIQFDEKIVGAEFLRDNQSDPIAQKTRACTMLASTHFCQIPGPYGFKWPKLQELYTKLFQEDFANAHNALADVRACAKCYFELKRLGAMD